MDKITLINYRCFTRLELSFSKHINLFIGDNASGKTTILRAIKSVLSSFFTGYSDEHTRFLGLSKSDFTQLISADSLANPQPIELRFKLLDHSASMRLESAKARQSTRTGTRTLQSIKQYAKNLQTTLFDAQQNQIKSLPLFTSFSTEDIHSNRKLSIEPFKQYLHKPSFGYYECLNGEGFFPYWIKRLLVLKEANKGEIEILGVRQAIQKALGEGGCNIIRDMEIRPIQGKVYYYLIDGREVEAENLSDGYTRLVNVVTDIAFRCMILNKGIYGSDSCSKTTGIVLIDEIDLHLHPTLQSTILKGLRIAFPNLQFIASTHAPMVMTGVESDEGNRIYKLTYTLEEGYKATISHLYGMDASSILKSVLNTLPRAKEVDDELEKLFSLIDNEKYDDANSKLKEMNHSFEGTPLPELNKAQIMLDFLEDKNEKD